MATLGVGGRRGEEVRLQVAEDLLTPSTKKMLIRVRRVLLELCGCCSEIRVEGRFLGILPKVARRDDDDDVGDTEHR